MSTLCDFGFVNPIGDSECDRFRPLWEWIKKSGKVTGTDIFAKLISTFGSIGRLELEWFYKLIYIYPLKRTPVVDARGIMYDEWYEVLPDDSPKAIKARNDVAAMGGEPCEFCGDKSVKLMVSGDGEKIIPLCDRMECFYKFNENNPFERFKIKRTSGWDLQLGDDI